MVEKKEEPKKEDKPAAAMPEPPKPFEATTIPGTSTNNTAQH
jgi:hypothetical protein